MVVHGGLLWCFDSLLTSILICLETAFLHSGNDGNKVASFS